MILSINLSRLTARYRCRPNATIARTSLVAMKGMLARLIGVSRTKGVNKTKGKLAQPIRSVGLIISKIPKRNRNIILFL